MKITVVSVKQPIRASGSEVRDYYLLKNLNLIANVHLICGNRTHNEHYKKNISYFDIPKETLFQRIVAILLNRVPYFERLRNSDFGKITAADIDAPIIQFNELESFFAAEKFLSKLTGIKVLDCHNIDNLRFKGEINSYSGVKKFIGNLLVKKYKEEEINALKKVDYILVCSDEDKRIFSEYVNSKKIAVIPNGVDCDYFKPSLAVSRPVILFMGLLSYPPNELGLRNFLDKIYPNIRREVNDVSIVVIGANCPGWLKDMAETDKSINLVGYVDDVRPHIAQAKVCICPLSEGSGTRLKILEYMAMGKAVVSTSKGAEGIKYEEDKDILIADTSEMFANSCVQLLKNDYSNQKIGLNSRKLVEKVYQWPHVGDILLYKYKKLAAYK